MTMKHLIKLTLVLLALLLPANATAYDFNVDGIYYNINGNNATVTYYFNSYSGDITIPETVTYNGTTYTVTSIGNSAFEGCTGLTNIDIPNSVTAIGSYAFEGCTGLTSVNIPNSVTAIDYGTFRDCSGLTNIDIPNSVTAIGSSAFEGCTGLTSIVIPNSVTSIGSYAFEGNTGLTSVNIPNSVTAIDNGTFEGCTGLTSIVIPNSVTSIGGWAFSGCSGLTSVTIGNSVTTIGWDAFRGCSGLTSVTIGNSVTSIDGWAFSGCSGLTSLDIPNSVTTIGQNAFSSCSGLMSVTIGNSVTSIGANAFEYCIGLTSVNIFDVDAWCKITFSSSESNPLYYANHLYINGEEITDLVIPNSVTEIGDYAFCGCSGLTSVTIPNSVTSIGNSAFADCSGLTSVNIPNSVTSIGSCAFLGCSGLRYLFFNAVNCTSIGDRAFNYTYSSIISVQSLQFGDSVQNIPAGLPRLNMSGKTLRIPNSVNTIAAGAINGSCDAVAIGNGLENIAAGTFPSGISVAYATAAEPLPCEADAFANPQTLYVPAGSKTKYFVAQGWGEFANIIEGEYNYTPATAIELDRDDVTLNRYATLQLSATVLPNSFTTTSIDWYSLDPNVASVSDNGMITANSVGETDIIVWVDQVSDTCHVKVTPIMVENITLNANHLSMGLDETYTLTVTAITPNNAENKTLEWEIPENDVIATLMTSENHLNIGAIGEGTVTITVRATDGSGVSASCVVNVSQFIIHATSIALDETSARLAEGETLQLTATVLPEDATDKTVTWTSSDETVATVTSEGLVTAIASGSATITATTNDCTNISASCLLTVTPLIFHFNDTIALAGTTVAIPIVLNNNVIVRGLMFDFHYPEGFQINGHTKTDRFTDETFISGVNHSDYCYYHIAGLNFSTNIILEPGSGPILYIKVKIPEDASGDYEISLKNISVSINQSSSFLPADIYATLSVTGIDLIPVTSISLNQTSALLNENETLQLTASIMPEEATIKTVTWLSSNTTVANVDANGLVTAVAPGTATITATTTDGSNLSASCVVTFVEPQMNYDNILSIADTTVFHGETIVIPVKMNNEESIMAFQTDIFLPEGFSIMTDEDEEPIITPSSRLTSDHVILADQISDGSVRIICYTPRSRLINGNEGDLFYITVIVPEDAGGDYNIFLRNSLLTASDYSELSAPDAGAVLHVNTYIPGDVNDSRTVTVTDIVFTAQYILEHDPHPFIFEAADMNGDGNITVTDIMLIANLIMTPTTNAPKRSPILEANGDNMNGESITLGVGETRTVSIMLNNAMDYTAFQLDMKLPNGLMASNFALTNRAGSHAFDVDAIANGNIRALCYSPDLTAINDHEGALLTFDVTATDMVDGSIDVEGIEMVTTTCQTVHLDAFAIGVNSETSVNELSDHKSVAHINYYNMAGQELTEPSCGVTLVVITYTDGTRTTTKVFK